MLIRELPALLALSVRQTGKVAAMVANRVSWRMRSGLAIFAVAAAAACTFAPARADHQPAFVVPGRADVPVMINGYNAAWGVVEGDFGLYRPGAVPIAVIPSPFPQELPPPARRYFPSLGAAPHSGRYEIEPPANRKLPPPAEEYFRSWSSSSDMSAPVTTYAPSPPMIVTPEVPFFDGNRRRPHRR